MTPLFLTLCVEGSTDDMLWPIVRWALEQRLGPDVPIDHRCVHRSGSLADKIEAALREAAGCDLLVVHRDADQRDGHPARVGEIDAAVAAVASRGVRLPPVGGPASDPGHEVAAVASRGVRLPPHIRIIPVRKSEAWLLFDEAAIRRAADNPTGRAVLSLPRRDFDLLPDPKLVLYSALDRANESSGRKLDKFQRRRRPAWVADQIDDFAPLRQLPAFVSFEAEVAAFADAWLTAPHSA